MPMELYLLRDPTTGTQRAGGDEYWKNASSRRRDVELLKKEGVRPWKESSVYDQGITTPRATPEKMEGCAMGSKALMLSSSRMQLSPGTEG